MRPNSPGRELPFPVHSHHGLEAQILGEPGSRLRLGSGDIGSHPDPGEGTALHLNHPYLQAGGAEGGGMGPGPLFQGEGPELEGEASLRIGRGRCLRGGGFR